ncbi:hypothetical protein B0H14DRAFT_2614147 [Mycena olivaceomarginata]|nr:hypothetical protein B0H14DRAFT_2614147 [Mycena olivaceomarginata]
MSIFESLDNHPALAPMHDVPSGELIPHALLHESAKARILESQNGGFMGSARMAEDSLLGLPMAANGSKPAFTHPTMSKQFGVPMQNTYLAGLVHMDLFETLSSTGPMRETFPRGGFPKPELFRIMIDNRMWMAAGRLLGVHIRLLGFDGRWILYIRRDVIAGRRNLGIPTFGRIAAELREQFCRINSGPTRNLNTPSLGLQATTTLQTAASLACNVVIGVSLRVSGPKQKWDAEMVNSLMMNAVIRGMLTAASSTATMILRRAFDDKFLIFPDTFWFFLSLAPNSKSCLRRGLNMCQYIRDKVLPNGWDTIDLGEFCSNGPGTRRPAMVLAIEFVKPEVTVLEIGIGPGQLIIIVKGEEETLHGTTAESAYPSTDSITTATA